MKKRIVCALLAVIMIASVLTGCFGSGSTTKKKREKKEYVSPITDISQVAVGPYKWPAHKGIDYTKPYNKRFDGLEFTIALNTTGMDLPEGYTPEENPNTWMFEGKTGLKAKVAWVANGAAYDQKIGQCVASGEIPDLMFVSFKTYLTLVKAGLIADLTDELLEGDHPTLQSIWKERNYEALESLKVDGRIYGIPSTAASFDGSPLLWIRKDWREKLGIAEPKSLKDIENLALAFINEDPDGNGKNDTYGLCATAQYGCDYGGDGNFCNLILNLGGAAPCTYQLQEDGTLVYGSTMPGAKHALEYLNNWYNKGIIPDDYPTWDNGAVTDAIGNDRVGICMGPWYAGSTTLYNNYAINESAEWEAYLLPENEGDPVYASEGDAVIGIYVVSDTFEYPEAFVYAYDMNESFGNEFNKDAPDLKFSYANLEGYQVVSGSYNPMGSALHSDYYTRPVKELSDRIEAAGGFAAMNSVEDIENLYAADPVDDPMTNTRVKSASLPCMGVALAVAKGENPRSVIVKDESHEYNLPASYQFYLNYWEGPKAIARANPIGVSTRYTGVTPGMAIYSTFLSSLEKEAYTKMIMGKTDGMSISDYFDKFVNDYMAQGGQALQDEINAAYKEMKES